MTANLVNVPDARRIAASGGVEEALYFSSGERQLFGWLHWPANRVAGGLGLVICNPFGYESLCAHQAIRAFGEAAADLGVTVLRFDYAGTGDSEDLPPGSDQVEAWSQDVITAMQFLLQRAGIKRVALLGFRLGALIAGVAASRSSIPSALISIAPVMNGKAYVRELTTMRLASAQAPPFAWATLRREPGEGVPLEVGGFSLSPSSLRSLLRADLLTLQMPSISDALIIDRHDLPRARAWQEALAASGVATHYDSLPGLVPMMLTEPHLAVVPGAMIELMRTWLSSLQAATVAQSVSAVQRSPAAIEPAFAAFAVRGELTERPMLFGSDRALFGIVTEPQHGEARRRGVILLNDGATNHVGSSRMCVSLARRWAQRGYVVLRMDLAGLGDSTVRPGHARNEVFPSDAVADVRDAVALLRGRYNAQEVTLAGLCSGAYHALRAAVCDVPVDRIFMVNPLNFYWEEGMTLEELQIAQVVHNMRAYRERVFSIAQWRRLLTGQVKFSRAGGIVLRRLWLGLQSVLRDAAQRLHVGQPEEQSDILDRVQGFDLGKELARVVARGIRIVFVFSRGDTGIDLLKTLGGSSIPGLGQNYRVHVVDGADHIFSHSAPRTILGDILSNELYVRKDPDVMAPENRNAVA